MFNIGIEYPKWWEPIVYLDSSDIPFIIMEIGILKQHSFNVSTPVSSLLPMAEPWIGSQSLRIVLGPTLLDPGSRQEDCGIHGVSIRGIQEEQMSWMEEEMVDSRRLGLLIWNDY